jgi:RNA polymerase sigma-70 factor (ECF subfamily)
VDIYEGNNLIQILEGCMKNDRKSQKLLYQQFFGYAMSICMRYTQNQADAVEVLNDSFMKVFTQLNKFDQTRSFKSWFRRILINASIDHLKSEMKHQFKMSLEENEKPLEQPSVDQKISHEELIGLIQHLSPAYRSVFNLYVIDGYKHEEIAGMLGISVGTSKSNLAKARLNLRAMLKKIERHEIIRIARSGA